MTKAEAISLIQNRLGQRLAVDSLIEQELGAAQVLEESREQLPWFLAARVAGSAGAGTNALPSGFLAEVVDDPFVWLVTSEGTTPLVKKAMWEVERVTGTGTPLYYVLEPTGYTLFPQPEGAISVELSFMRADTPMASLSSGATNLWLTHAPLVLVNSAGLRVASHLRSLETAQLFQANLQEAMVAMWRKHYAMGQGGRGVAMGG